MVTTRRGVDVNLSVKENTVKECAMRAGIDFALAGWGQKNLNTPISYLTPLDAIQHLCI